MTQRITVTIERGGAQERPYGNHVYFGIVQVEHKYGNHWTPWENATESIIKQYMRGFVHFTDDWVWPEPHLKSLTQVRPGVWRYRIESDFVD